MITKEIVSQLRGTTTPVLLGPSLKSRVSIPFNTPVRYVELIFGTYKRVPQGTLYASLSIGDDVKAFKINMSSIRDNEPFVFDLGDHFTGSSVDISLVANFTDPTASLALWYDDVIPSHTLYKNRGYKVREMESKPLISIITATYKIPLDIFKKTVSSVISQSYSNWEWVIVDDCSQDTELSNFVNSLARKEKNIRAYESPKNKGISAAQNKALSKIKGEWVIVLDHDDTLPSIALSELALCINRKPDADLIYTDEDKIDENDVISSPFFKPGWSPALFLCQNYINHLTAFRVDRVKSHVPGGYESRYDGSQDYRFLMKYLWGPDLNTPVPKANVVHIPKVLYHWRTLPSSVSSGVEAKPYALRAAREALSDLLAKSIGGGSIFNTTNLSVYRPLLETHSDPSVNIVIPAKDHFDVTGNCLESLLKTKYDSAYISIVDNGSPSEKAFPFYDSFLKSTSSNTLKPLGTQLSYGHYTFNFSYQSNKGFSLFDTEYVLFLNNDTEVIDQLWLREMVSWMVNYPDVGAVGARLLYPNGTLQHGGVDMGVGGVAGHTLKGLPYGSGGYFCRAMTVHEVSAVTGACLLVRSSVFKEVGKFNESLPQAFNDVDLCLKIRKAGHRIVYTPWAMLYHHESISRGRGRANDPSFDMSVKYMHDTWMPEIQNDPYFNPNFARNSDQYVPRKY